MEPFFAFFEIILSSSKNLITRLDGVLINTCLIIKNCLTGKFSLFSGDT